jgi:hypothetical protein
MKYQQPYGISDPNAPYINGDPSIGRMGSIPPAAAFEQPMRELVSVITNSQLTPSDTDLQQVAKAVRSQRMNYADDTGSANTLSVAYNPPISTYTIGLPLVVKIHTTNTGPSTIDAGAGRVSIRKPTGAEMGAGDLPAGGLAELVYDGTNFQMINFGGAGAGGPINTFLVNIPYTVDVGTPNTIIANFSPALTSYTAGMIFMVKIANTNTTFANINVNGLGLKPISAQGSTTAYPLLPCDLVAGDVLIFVYDGSRFWIYANDIINIAVAFTVSNNTQISDLFFALGRKRILTTGTAYVTITLASGIYSQFQTQHPNADRMTVQGTMLAAAPVLADFARSGNSASARANDASNNINMLRTRYGTEVRFTNSTVNTCVMHTGGGTITFKDLLVTGQNTPAGITNGQVAGIGPVYGGSVICTNVAVWGSGSFGFYVLAGSMQCFNCYASSSQQNGGFTAGNGGSMALAGCGAFGCAENGVLCFTAGSANLWQRSGVPGSPDLPACAVQCNGNQGVLATRASNVSTGAANITSNGVDLYAVNMSMITVDSAVYGTTSPAVGTTGNGNALVA